MDQNVQHFVPNVEEWHLILWTIKHSEERNATKVMKHGVRHLLPMSVSKVCALSSAQIERHNVAKGCPVAPTGAIAGSTGKRSKQFNVMRNPQRTKRKVSSIEFIITIVKGVFQQLSAPLVTSKFNWGWLLTRQMNTPTSVDGVLSSSLVYHFCFCGHIASPGETRSILSRIRKTETIKICP